MRACSAVSSENGGVCIYLGLFVAVISPLFFAFCCSLFFARAGGIFGLASRALGAVFKGAGTCGQR